jgi:urease accessory protein
MGGRPVETIGQGLMSGLAHPVIGLDHLAFIIAIGIAATLVRGGAGLPLLFIAGSAAGVLAHVARLDVPFAELTVAASVICIGAALAAGRPGSSGVWLGFVAGAGLLHGYAFGESVVGVEATPIVAYVLGLSLVAAAIAYGVMALTRAVSRAYPEPSSHVRWAGVLIAAIGVVVAVPAAIA